MYMQRHREQGVVSQEWQVPSDIVKGDNEDRRDRGKENPVGRSWESRRGWVVRPQCNATDHGPSWATAFLSKLEWDEGPGHTSESCVPGQCLDGHSSGLT